MIVSELIKAMADAGAPMEAILIAVRALEQREAQIDAKRAVERDRKRRQRAKDKHPEAENAKDMDGTVTGQSRDMDGTVTVTPPLSLPPNENISNPPTHTPPDNKPARGKSGIPAKPAEVSDGVWTDFLDLRRRKRAPMTETALAGIKREAGKAGWSLEDVLAKCLARGWQGFEAGWVKDEPKQGNSAGQADSYLSHMLAKRQREQVQ